MKRILIGGTNSGCGKTSVACAVLRALQMQGLRVSSFKCGPDYIDPMFHREIIGARSANLDGFFCDPPVLKKLLSEESAGTDIAVIEGVMGYYDGMKAGGSAYDIARMTDTKAVIVIDCHGMSETIGAVMDGFLRYREPSFICGFLFNRLPASLVDDVKQMCAARGTAFIGYLPRHGISLQSRNLGLVTAQEVPDLQEKIDALGVLAAAHIDLELLMKLAAKTDDAASAQASVTEPAADGPVIAVAKDRADGPVIAVAKDRAFCFLYPENIRMLEKCGCRIRYFSPLTDATLPEADGLYLPGGYPELHAKELSENVSMRESIRSAVRGGMPTIAECGGFLYLHRELRMQEEEMADGMGQGCSDAVYPMCGVIDAAAFPRKSLQRFGYVTLTAKETNLLCVAGDRIRAHEFHYWESEEPGDLFEAIKPDGRSWTCGIGTKTLYAGFPHLYFYAKPQMAQRFAAAAAAYHAEKMPCMQVQDGDCGADAAAAPSSAPVHRSAGG